MKTLFKSIFPLFLLLFLAAEVTAQKNDPAGRPSDKSFGPSLTPDEQPETDSVLVTVVLRHQQDKNLAELRRKLERQGFWNIFPPKDVKVVSWNIAMGYGHIITLQVPANAVRRLNLSLINGAWGAYDTDVYLSYDYVPIWEEYMEKREEARREREDN